MPSTFVVAIAQEADLVVPVDFPVEDHAASDIAQLRGTEDALDLRVAANLFGELRGEAALSSNRPLGSLQPPTCDPPESVLEVDRCVPSCGKAGGNSCDPVLCEGHMTFESYDCAVCCDLDF